MLLKKKQQKIAIVGITRETAELLPLLLRSDSAEILRILNPTIDQISDLQKLEGLDVIVNASNDPVVQNKLRRLELSGVDILGALSARILFLADGHGGGTDSFAEDRSRILRSLHEVKQAVLLSKNKEELLKLLLQVIISTCRADSGSIMLVDAQKRFLKIEMADGLNIDVTKSSTQKFGRGVAGKVARTGKPILIKGTVEKDGTPQDAHRPELTSAICCPLVLGTETVGVVNVNSKRVDHIFNEDDLRYVKELSEFTADVIQTSKDLEATSSSTFALSLVNSAREILSLDFPYEERLNLLVMKIVNAFDGAICNFYRYNPEKQMFLVCASSSLNMDLLKGKGIKLNDTLAQKVLANESTTCISTDRTTRGARKWYIAHPVRSNDEIRGLLFLHLVSDKADLSEETGLIAKIGDLIGKEMTQREERHLLEMQSTKLVAVSEASFNIASAENLRDLINFVLPNVCLILEAQAGLFWLLNPVSDQLELYSAFSIENQDEIAKLEMIDRQVFDATVPGDDVTLIRDLKKEGFTSETHAPKSVISKSFGTDGHTAAVLSLYGKKSLDLFGSKSFTHQDKEVFLKFCLQFSKGLARVMPYFDERR